MSMVKPMLAEIIAFDVNAVKNAKEWVHTFCERYDEVEFLKYARPFFESVEEDKAFLDEFFEEEIEGKETFELTRSFPENGDLELFGLYPMFHLEESSLHGHDLLYAALESGLLPDETKALKIPYTDYSYLIGADRETVIQEVKHLQKRRDILSYKGKWCRDYSNHPLYWFDQDLEFAFQFFTQQGLPITRKDLNRYVLFEWQ